MLAYDVGTSFAAPLVSHYAAIAFHEYAGCTPNLVHVGSRGPMVMRRVLFR